MVFYAQSDVPCISVQALLKKYCLSQSAGINKFAVWFLPVGWWRSVSWAVFSEGRQWNFLPASVWLSGYLNRTNRLLFGCQWPTGVKKLRFSFVFSFSFHYFWLPLHWRLLKHAILAGLIVCRHASCRACVRGTACFVHVVFFEWLTDNFFIKYVLRF